jgi:hypothetical protein
MFFDKHKAPAGPVEDLANLKVTDARVGDTLSVVGAGDEFADLDFTVDHRNEYESGSHQWFEVTGMYRDRRVYLEVFPGDELEVHGYVDPRRLTLDEMGLTEDDLSAIDDRQNPADFLDIEGKFWLYRFSKEIGLFRDGREPATGFYCWQFREQEGKRFLTVRKFENEPFVGLFSELLNPGDITVWRGK